VFAGKKSAQIREILISESAWEEMTCLFAPSLNIGWPAFTAYGMAVSDSKTYPIASSIINSGGNLGGFVAPMAAGFLLDKTGSFNSVFTYFGICAAIGLVVILFLDEPQ
ncbi:MFS transporter, partial [Klebsiella pneumoniae]